MAEATVNAPDLFGPEFTQDPYPAYQWLREHSPVHRLALPQGPPAWLVTRQTDVRALLVDQRLAKDLHRFLPEVALPSEDLRNLLTQHMLAVDPPAHTRLRQLVAREFTARRVEGVRDRVGQIADGLLDGMGAAGQADLVQAFAVPLPLTVICEMLGVPMADMSAFHEWSRIASDGQSLGGPEFEASTRVLQDYVIELIAAKRGAPGPDLLSDLIAVRDGGDRLTDDELVAMVFLLLLGGHETVVSLISSAAFHLLTHPEQLAQLRAEPGRIVEATEEFLRYDTPAITTSMRFAAEEIEVGDVRIPAGDVVFLALGSANRDPGARTEDPERFDICRKDTQHLAFGAGVHSCLGSALARLECQVAITALLARFSRLELAAAPEEIAWRPGLHFRGPVALPVSYAVDAGATT
ncbi:MAG: cytochrome P450 [Jatrophihabitantaceae bacterium]